MQRKILHIDLDAFFCAVEELLDPSLKNKPFAVGGSPDHRGVVASCSYAARKYGIHSAMPMARAVRLCPQLEIRRHHFRDYMRLSDQVRDIMDEYSGTVQPISIDEAFLDLSHQPEDPVIYARKLQTDIRVRLGLPSSIGVASNKLVAKVATNVGKASVRTDGYPNAIQVVPPGEEAAFLAPLPSDALWGVGKKTAEKLAALGIFTVGDIAKYPLGELTRQFGQIGTDLHYRSQGIDNSAVHVSYETKSVSHENTYARDTNDERVLRASIKEMSDSIAKRLRDLEHSASTVKLKLRWSDFTTFTRQSTLKEPTDQAKEIEAMALKLLRAHWKNGRLVRLIGVGASKLAPRSKQLNLWDWDPKDFEKKQRLEDAIAKLKRRYGDAAPRHASDLKAKA
jgi:DNA polymerase-4